MMRHMSRLTRTLIPVAQRQPIEALQDALDLGYGDKLAKRTGFLIMLVLSAIIAICGIIADSTATVIGAMIIAPLGTPILGIAFGIVSGHLTLVLRSLFWVAMGLVIVVFLGLGLRVPRRRSEEPRDELADPRPHVAAPARSARRPRDRDGGGVRHVPPRPQRRAAGRRDLDLARPAARRRRGVRRSGGVVRGVRGARPLPLERRGARHRRQHRLHDRGLLARSELVADGEPAPRLHRRHRAVAHRRAAARLQHASSRSRSRGGRPRSTPPRPSGSTDSEGSKIDDVHFHGFEAKIAVTDSDGVIPDTAPLAESLAGLPSFVTVVVDVGLGYETPVR